MFHTKKIKNYGLGFLSFLKNIHYEKRIDEKLLVQKNGPRYLFFNRKKKSTSSVGPKNLYVLSTYLCSNLGKNLTSIHIYNLDLIFYFFWQDLTFLIDSTAIGVLWIKIF